MTSDVPRAPRFELGQNIHENVKALRVALGSVVQELSAAKLAALVSERHSSRSVAPSLVQRWESGVEPDFESTRIMAALAGVSFEEFALGRPTTSHERAIRAVAEEPKQKYEGPPMYWGEPVTKKPAAKKVAEGGKKKR